MLKALKNDTKDTKPHVVYKKLLSEDCLSGTEAVAKPRNAMQVQNAKAKEKRQKCISHCQFYDAVLIGKQLE